MQREGERVKTLRCGRVSLNSDEAGREVLASARADKWLDMHRHASALACADELRRKGFAIHGSRLEGDAVDVAELPFGERLALVFGNEGVSKR